VGRVAPAAEFVSAIMASLDHWQEQTYNLDDPTIVELDKERQNLFRAMQFGLALPQAWETAAAVAVQAVPLVNRRMYRTEWLPVLRRLLERVPAGQIEWRIRLLVQYGRLLRMQRQLDYALEIHQEALALAIELDDAHLLALATYNLGRVYLDKRQYQEAERYSRAVIAILGETDDQELLALAYNSLGQAAQDRGVLGESLDYLTKALEINRNRGDIAGLGRSLIWLANTLRASGRLEEAIVYYEEASEVLAKTASELDKILLAVNLGGAYFEKQEWLLAERTFRQANSAYLQQSSNLHYQALVTVCLGNTLLKQSRLVEAEAMLRQSVQLWRQVDDNLNLANALGSLGEALAAQGVPEAGPCLDEALALLNAYPEVPWASSLRKLFQRERTKLAGGQD
jgi:tetratricopeptide (TPR) repeat protein